MTGGLLNRRLFSLALALAAALLIAACGGDDDEDSTTSAEGGETSQFTTAEFQKTLDAVTKDAGANAELLQIQITAGGTDYQIREGEGATGLHFDVGSSDPQEVEVQPVGTGSFEDTAYPLARVIPAAIDKMVAAAPKASGTDDFAVTVMTLQRNFTTGKLEWTINGDGGGRTGIVLTANPDGSGLASPGAEAPAGTTGKPMEGQTPGETPPPTTPEEVQDIADCIADAVGNQKKLQKCADRAGPRP